MILKHALTIEIPLLRSRVALLTKVGDVFTPQEMRDLHDWLGAALTRLEHDLRWARAEGVNVGAQHVSNVVRLRHPQPFGVE